MTQNTAVIASGNVSGNIGSCKVNTETIPISSFYKQTIAVNSCTGETVANNTYYDWGYIYLPLVFVFVGVSIIAVIRGILN